jgi:hypothetical protein
MDASFADDRIQRSVALDPGQIQAVSDGGAGDG